MFNLLEVPVSISHYCVSMPNDCLLLWFEYEMSSIGLCFSTLGPQMIELFGNVMEP